MDSWWLELSLMLKILYMIAVPSTVILLIQTIMTLAGLGDLDSDTDFSDVGDIDTDISDDIGSDDFGYGIKFFSLRGIIAFLTVFGWTGITIAELFSPAIVIVISLVAGLAAMAVIAFMFFSMSKLQSNGNVRIGNAVGKTGTVYLKIPSERKATGKIQLVVQGRFVEMDAMTDSEHDLPSGREIVVEGIVAKTIVLVKEINSTDDI